MKKLLFVAVAGMLVACGDSETKATPDSTVTVTVDSSQVAVDTTVLVDTSVLIKDTSAPH